MKLPLEWLREMAPLDAAPEHIAELLTMGGLEVEELSVGADFTQVVVARVLQVERHPNADRLNVCQVDAGEASPRTIVCGAPNVAPGLLVPCALPGAVLPGDFAIKLSTVRGVASAGMLCSARELGISEDSQGLLVLDAASLPAAVPGADLRQVLGLDQPCLELKMTPNRGDCLSVLGVARDLCALAGVPLQEPVTTPVPVTTDERLPVRVEAPELCGRFTGRVVRGLNARASTPDWMRRRLEQSGQRSVSALVDISNYLMLEIGQPSHVFDLAKVQGGLQVRWALPDESITLLNEQTVNLDPSIGVVADAAGPEAVAAIMGGLSTSVTLDTTDVYLEAAFWWPESIQGRPRRLNLASEAAHRFERGVDFAGTPRAVERLTQLIVQICGTAGTRVGPLDDTLLALPERPPVSLRLSQLRRVLGIPLQAQDVQSCLDRLALVNRFDAATQTYTVEAPSFRFDMQREVDLIEEVARIYGYARIPALPPRASAQMRARPEGVRSVHALRHGLADAGYQELLNFSFVAEEWEANFGGDPARAIRVLNPIASQYTLMRSNLVAGLVANLRYNLNRQASRVRTFEIGRVFGRDAQQADGPLDVAGVRQALHMAGLAFGSADVEQWGVRARPVDFFDIKGDLERLFAPLRARFAPLEAGQGAGLAQALHPGRGARIFLGEQPVGWLGELHPRLCAALDLPAAPVFFEVLVEPLLDIGLPDLQAVPRFPALIRDIAVWTDVAVPAGGILEDLRAYAASTPALALVRAVHLFDVFRPDPAKPVAQTPAEPAQAASDSSSSDASSLLIKEKSLAFRIVLQDTQRSLAESDADAARAAILAHLLERWGARLR